MFNQTLHKLIFKTVEFNDIVIATQRDADVLFSELEDAFNHGHTVHLTGFFGVIRPAANRRFAGDWVQLLDVNHEDQTISLGFATQAYTLRLVPGTTVSIRWTQA